MSQAAHGPAPKSALPPALQPLEVTCQPEDSPTSDTHVDDQDIQQSFIGELASSTSYHSYGYIPNKKYISTLNFGVSHIVFATPFFSYHKCFSFYNRIL